MSDDDAAPTALCPQQWDNVLHCVWRELSSDNGDHTKTFSTQAPSLSYPPPVANNNRVLVPGSTQGQESFFEPFLTSSCASETIAASSFLLLPQATDLTPRVPFHKEVHARNRLTATATGSLSAAAPPFVPLLTTIRHSFIKKETVATALPIIAQDDRSSSVCLEQRPVSALAAPFVPKRSAEVDRADDAVCVQGDKRNECTDPLLHVASGKLSVAAVPFRPWLVKPPRIGKGTMSAAAAPFVPPVALAAATTTAKRLISLPSAVLMNSPQHLQREHRTGRAATEEVHYNDEPLDGFGNADGIPDFDDGEAYTEEYLRGGVFLREYGLAEHPNVGYASKDLDHYDYYYDGGEEEEQEEETEEEELRYYEDEEGCDQWTMEEEEEGDCGKTMNEGVVCYASGEEEDAIITSDHFVVWEMSSSSFSSSPLTRCSAKRLSAAAKPFRPWLLAEKKKKAGMSVAAPPFCPPDGLCAVGPRVAVV
jgi:hypothetical protein